MTNNTFVNMKPFIEPLVLLDSASGPKIIVGTSMKVLCTFFFSFFLTQPHLSTVSIFCNNNEQGQLITVQGRGSSVLSHLLRKVKALFHRWSRWIHFHIHQLLCHRLYGRRNFTDLDQISQFRRVKTSFSSRKPPDSVRTKSVVY